MSSQRLLFPEAAVLQGRQGPSTPPRRRLVRVAAPGAARALRVARRSPPPVVEPVPAGPMADHVTEAALEALFSPEALAEGRAAVAAGRVFRPSLRGAHADALVEGADQQRHHVRLGWSVLGLGAACSCGVGRCPHGAALGLFLLEGAAAQARPPALVVVATERTAASDRLASAPLGGAAGSEPGPRSASATGRLNLADLAERKLVAASALSEAGQGAEALPLYRVALELACRAIDPVGDPGDDAAALLAEIHGSLVPSGLLTAAEAAAIARAGEAARAFGGSTLPPPAALVAAVAGDAEALVARARRVAEEAKGEPGRSPAGR